MAVLFAINKSPAESIVMPKGALSPVEATEASVLAVTETPKIVPEACGITETLFPELFVINKSPAESKVSPAGPLNPEVTTLASVLAVTETPKIVPEACGITETLFPELFAINKSPAKLKERPFGILNPEVTTLASVLAVTETPKIVPEAIGITEILLAVLFAINKSPAELKERPAGPLNPDAITESTLAVTETPKIVPDAAGTTETVFAVKFAINKSPAESKASPSG